MQRYEDEDDQDDLMDDEHEYAQPAKVCVYRAQHAATPTY
jgi:hypothetical protein